MSVVDKEQMQELYDLIRNDKQPIAWAVFKYEGKNIVPGATGETYEEFLTHFKDDQRLYGFVRVNTGDEMSIRSKFVLITWVGKAVKAVLRAQVSTDKAFVKGVIKSYAKEILADNLDEIQLDIVLEQVRSVGGANYGTGVRD
eukprot:m.220674 g.220674  ORF g.220674 m.220674 type:complete len:143 (+) comp10431_c0_seq1:56-484(+)